MSDHRPGLNDRRLLRLMSEAIERCRLDLTGAVVLTEAASGPYVVTSLLAAMAGASHVYAVTRTTRHGTAEQVMDQTLSLAQMAGVAPRLTVATEVAREILGVADVVTNSGHVRPLDAETVAALKPTAVIPLMYESWEYRAADLDLAACRARGIAVAGTNERHPSVDVFSYLGAMAVRLLNDAGIAVYASRVLVLCDNDFGPYISRGLAAAGAVVTTATSLPASIGGLDAVLVAMKPGARPPVDRDSAGRLADEAPGVVVAQFWGDLDRGALDSAGVAYWPSTSPASGHMGILPSALGPEPIVRLQAGGLKVGEVMHRVRRAGGSWQAAVRAAVDSGFGQDVVEPAGGAGSHD